MRTTPAASRTPSTSHGISGLISVAITMPALHEASRAAKVHQGNGFS